jgi:purine-nucleoside phosphorylase
VYPIIRETVESIRARCNKQPVLGLILGSGLGAFADTLQDRVVIPFSEIPHFPCSTVLGHSGNLVAGSAEGIPCFALQGRVHLYEGYSIADVTYPVRVLGCLGVRQFIVTNAAGGINTEFQPGDLMLIRDHINFTGTNPLVGPNVEEWGPRFPDMSEAYDPAMRKIALEVAHQQGIPLHQGIYLGLCGPSYETPAEIRMFRLWGADAVGMSTVSEVIAASHMGIQVLGISCITNMAAGVLPRRLTHKEVLDTTESVKEKFLSLLRGLIPALLGRPGPSEPCLQ